MQLRFLSLQITILVAALLSGFSLLKGAAHPPSRVEAPVYTAAPLTDMQLELCMRSLARQTTSRKAQGAVWGASHLQDHIRSFLPCDTQLLPLVLEERPAKEYEGTLVKGCKAGGKYLYFLYYKEKTLYLHRVSENNEELVATIPFATHVEESFTPEDWTLSDEIDEKQHLFVGFVPSDVQKMCVLQYTIDYSQKNSEDYPLDSHENVSIRDMPKVYERKILEDNVPEDAHAPSLIFLDQLEYSAGTLLVELGFLNAPRGIFGVRYLYDITNAMDHDLSIHKSCFYQDSETTGQEQWRSIFLIEEKIVTIDYEPSRLPDANKRTLCTVTLYSNKTDFKKCQQREGAPSKVVKMYGPNDFSSQMHRSKAYANSKGLFLSLGEKRVYECIIDWGSSGQKRPDKYFGYKGWLKGRNTDLRPKYDLHFSSQASNIHYATFAVFIGLQDANNDKVCFLVDRNTHKPVFITISHDGLMPQTGISTGRLYGGCTGDVSNNKFTLKTWVFSQSRYKELNFEEVSCIKEILNRFHMNWPSSSYSEFMAQLSLPTQEKLKSYFASAGGERIERTLQIPTSSTRSVGSELHRKFVIAGVSCAIGGVAWYLRNRWRTATKSVTKLPVKQLVRSRF